MSYAPDPQRQLESRIELVPLVGVLAALVVLLLATMPKDQRVANNVGSGDWIQPLIEYHAVRVKANGLLDVDGREMGVPALTAQHWQPRANDRHVIVTLSSDDAANYQDFTDARSALARMGLADEEVLLESNGGIDD